MPNIEEKENGTDLFIFFYQIKHMKSMAFCRLKVTLPFIVCSFFMTRFVTDVLNINSYCYQTEPMIKHYHLQTCGKLITV